MPAAAAYFAYKEKDAPYRVIRYGAVLLRRSFIFRMQKVRDAAQKQKAADDAGLHAEGAAF